MIKSHEKERYLIFQKLHEGVAQELVAAKMFCEVLSKNSSNYNPECQKLISKIIGILQKSIIDIRDLSYNLWPPNLDELGLSNILYRYCVTFSEKTGIKVDFKSSFIDNTRLSPDIRINLYRIIEEALNNIRRHTESDSVKVVVGSTFNDIIIRIEDTTKGFEPRKRLGVLNHENWMGFQYMQERINLLGGKMSIHVNPESGTKILIKAPYNPGSGLKA